VLRGRVTNGGDPRVLAGLSTDIIRGDRRCGGYRCWRGEAVEPPLPRLALEPLERAYLGASSSVFTAEALHC